MGANKRFRDKRYRRWWALRFAPVPSPLGPPRGSLPYLEARLECWRLTRGRNFVPSRHQSLSRRGEGGWPFVPFANAHEAETSFMAGLMKPGNIAEVRSTAQVRGTNSVRRFPAVVEAGSCTIHVSVDIGVSGPSARHAPTRESSHVLHVSIRLFSTCFRPVK